MVLATHRARAVHEHSNYNDNDYHHAGSLPADVDNRAYHDHHHLVAVYDDDNNDLYPIYHYDGDYSGGRLVSQFCGLQ